MGWIDILVKRLLGTNGKGCPDPECSNKVHETSVVVNRLESDFHGFKEDMYNKINDTTTLVADLNGYIRGKLG